MVRPAFQRAVDFIYRLEGSFYIANSGISSFSYPLDNINWSVLSLSVYSVTLSRVFGSHKRHFRNMELNALDFLRVNTPGQRQMVGVDSQNNVLPE